MRPLETRTRAVSIGVVAKKIQSKIRTQKQMNKRYRESFGRVLLRREAD